MTGAPQTAVTPAGVRDGDPAALSGLIARRGPAVLGFCRAVCDEDVVAYAAAEAFARFRAAVVAADDPAGLNPEILLLGATRNAAAALARTPSGDDGWEVPMLLAGRAEDMLAPAETDQLTRILERSPEARSVEAAFRRAERAYRSPKDAAIDAAVMQTILEAAAAAAPIRAPGGETLLVAEPAVAEPETIAYEPQPEPEPEPAPEPQLEPEPEPESVLYDDDFEYEHEPYGDADIPVAETMPVHVARVAGLPRTRRHLHLPHPHLGQDDGPLYRYILPAIAIVIALVIVLAIAGVIGGDDPAPTPPGPAAIYVLLG